MKLQRRREATGMSREEVARQLEWSTSTIFRLGTGRSRPQPGNVRTLLELYGVTGPERDGLIQLTRDARQPGWRHSFRDVLPNPYEVYIGLEAGAASIRNFEPSVVPGLLQTEDYARETFRNGPTELDPDGVERLVEVRLARQKMMCGQLRYLADSAQQGKTTIQVVPYRAGAHAGTTGPFAILDFEEPGSEPAVRPRVHRRRSRGVALAARDPRRAVTPSVGAGPGRCRDDDHRRTRHAPTRVYEYGAQIFAPRWGILAILPPVAGAFAVVLLRRRPAHQGIED